MQIQEYFCFTFVHIAGQSVCFLSKSRGGIWEQTFRARVEGVELKRKKSKHKQSVLECKRRVGSDNIAQSEREINLAKKPTAKFVKLFLLRGNVHW